MLLHIHDLIPIVDRRLLNAHVLQSTKPCALFGYPEPDCIHHVYGRFQKFDKCVAGQRDPVELQDLEIFQMALCETHELFLAQWPIHK